MKFTDSYKKLVFLQRYSTSFALHLAFTGGFLFDTP